MAEKVDLVAEFREDTGKGASRRLRHSGKVPAIIYGAGREPRALAFDHNELLKQVQKEAFSSSVLNIQVGENIRPAILKDIQIHPAKRQVLHMDLQRVVADEQIRMTVPIHLLNTEAAVGVKMGGGSVSHMLTEAEVICLPKDLPEYLEVDIAGMELDQMLHLSDITLPEGVELTDLVADPPRDNPFVAIHVMRIAEEPEEVEGEEIEGEGEEVPAGEEAAPDENGDKEDSGD